MIRLPMIGSRRPPAAPGGGVISVKTPRVNPKCFPDQRTKDQDERAEPNAEAANDKPHHDRVVAARVGLIDAMVSPISRLTRISMSRAAASTMNVMTKRRSRARSAPKCKRRPRLR